MKRIIGFSSILFILIIITILYSEPTFNGETPGCTGDRCHSYNSGIISAVPQGDLQIEVTLNNVSPGDKVAGELVDSEGNVVDVMPPTENNPFTLTAPSAATYLVNAGSKKPSKDWDSVSVTLTVTDISDIQNIHIPAKIELLENHPNPFNNVTMIKFSVPQQSQVKLMIFNIKGQLVRVLADHTFSSGIHQIMWNGKDDTGRLVASGTYVYQLLSGNQNLSRKLILSK